MGPGAVWLGARRGLGRGPWRAVWCRAVWCRAHAPRTLLVPCLLSLGKGVAGMVEGGERLQASGLAYNVEVMWSVSPQAAGPAGSRSPCIGFPVVLP